MLSVSLCLVSSVVVAPSLQVGSRQFDPDTRYQIASVAQLDERRFSSSKDAGSNPARGASLTDVACFERDFWYDSCNPGVTPLATNENKGNWMCAKA